GQASDRRRPGHGLSRTPVRADAAPVSRRGRHHQDEGDLRPLRKPGGLYAATDSEPRTRGGRRRRILRGPLPGMLRPASVRESRGLKISIGSGEWGVGNGGVGSRVINFFGSHSLFPTPHSPLPTPDVFPRRLTYEHRTSDGTRSALRFFARRRGGGG